MEKTSALQFAKDAMEKLGTEEKLKLAEAIGHSIPDEFSVWIEKKYDDLLETDEEDILLAEEALVEYHANPGSAVPWNDFFEEQKKKLKESKTYADH